MSASELFCFTVSHAFVPGGRLCPEVPGLRNSWGRAVPVAGRSMRKRPSSAQCQEWDPKRKTGFREKLERQRQTKMLYSKSVNCKLRPIIVASHHFFPAATDFPKNIFYGLQRYLNNQTSFGYITQCHSMVCLPWMSHPYLWSSKTRAKTHQSLLKIVSNEWN